MHASVARPPGVKPPIAKRVQGLEEAGAGEIHISPLAADTLRIETMAIRFLLPGSLGESVMPLDIRRLPATTRTVTVDITTDAGEESVTLEYKPSAFSSPGVAHEIDTINSPRLPPLRRVSAFSDLLSRLIVSWDVTDGGIPYEPTAENISYLDVTFIRALLDALVQDRERMQAGDVPALVAPAPEPATNGTNGHTDETVPDAPESPADDVAY